MPSTCRRLRKVVPASPFCSVRCIPTGDVGSAVRSGRTPSSRRAIGVGGISAVDEGSLRMTRRGTIGAGLCSTRRKEEKLADAASTTSTVGPGAGETGGVGFSSAEVIVHGEATCREDYCFGDRCSPRESSESIVLSLERLRLRSASSARLKSSSSSFARERSRFPTGCICEWSA